MTMMTTMTIWRRFREALVSPTYGHFPSYRSDSVIFTTLTRIIHTHPAHALFQHHSQLHSYYLLAWMAL